MSCGDCLRRRLAAVCGRNCELCDAYQDSLCCGCGYQLGQTCRGECAIFQCCVGEQGLEHCGLCPDFPCHLFMSLTSPLDVAKRYRALCRRIEIGTIAWLDEQAERAGPGSLPGV
jgi:hypothetical protein